MDLNITPPSGKPAAGDRLTVQLESMGAQAMAVARHQGFTLLVRRGVPGETVEVEVDHVHARHATARVTQIVEPTEARATPVCPDFERCGGCDWQHVDYETQLAFKRQATADQLSRIGGVEPPADWRVVSGEQPLEYRDKLEFSVAWDGSGFRPALHGLDPGQQVGVSGCRLAPPDFTTIANHALNLIASHPDAEEDEPQATPGGLSRITVQGTLDAEGRPGGLAITLHFARRPRARLRVMLREELPEALAEAYPRLETVGLSWKGPRGDRIRTQLEVVRGRPFLLKTFGDRPYRVPVGGFFQVNPVQAARLRDFVLTLARKELGGGAGVSKGARGSRTPLVYDLFCGVGLYALPLAQAGFQVVGLEKQRDAVHAAERSAKEWGVADCAFHAADLANPGVLQKQISRHGQPSLMLVNPPRAGLAKPLAEAILHTAPPALIYVSCDGGTFARDAKRLAGDYQLEALTGFDLFPQTHHLELAALFRRKATQNL